MKNIFIENIDLLKKMLEFCSLKFGRYVLSYDPSAFQFEKNCSRYSIHMNEDRILMTESLEKALEIILELE